MITASQEKSSIGGNYELTFEETIYYSRQCLSVYRQKKPSIRDSQIHLSIEIENCLSLLDTKQKKTFFTHFRKEKVLYLKFLRCFLSEATFSYIILQHPTESDKLFVLTVDLFNPRSHNHITDNSEIELFMQMT